MHNSVRRSAALILLYLGELNRMKARFETQCGEDPSQSHANALKCYNRARIICPHEGKIFHELGVSCHHEEDYLAAVYFFARAMSCANPRISSKENLINLFQEIRLKDIEVTQT